MNCHEFEIELQRRADGEPRAIDECEMARHAFGCEPCRELQRGYRLIARSFTARPDPDRSKRIVDSVCAVASPVEPPIRIHRIQRIGWLVAAAVLGAVWLAAHRPETIDLAPAVSSRLVSSGPDAATVLFPELANASDTDSRDALPIADAVEPVTRLIRAVGRSLEAPVRPIAVSTSQAMGSLIRDFADPPVSMTPILQFGDWMGPASPKAMDGQPPSS